MPPVHFKINFFNSSISDENCKEKNLNDCFKNWATQKDSPDALIKLRPSAVQMPPKHPMIGAAPVGIVFETYMLIFYFIS